MTIYRLLPFVFPSRKGTNAGQKLTMMLRIRYCISKNASSQHFFPTWMANVLLISPAVLGGGWRSFWVWARVFKWELIFRLRCFGSQGRSLRFMGDSQEPTP